MSAESPQSDADLLHAVRAGDATAYRELHDRHVAAARSLARQLVRGEAEADDVVVESFTKILDLVGRGGGPSAGFRTYLLTVVRRTVCDRTRVADGQIPMGGTSLDPGVPFIDPALIGLERSLIAEAFLSLPERWRAVLWHTEVEHSPPADVAPLLGLSANGVTDLARRALAGLRQAYLQTHLAAPPPHTCRLALGSMSRYVRGVLARRDSKAVDEHVSGCPECRAVLLELTDVSRGLRVIIGPLIAGPVFAGYAAALAKERTPSDRPEGFPRALGRLGRAPGRLLGRVRRPSGQISGRPAGQMLGRMGGVPGSVLGQFWRVPGSVLGQFWRVPGSVVGWVRGVPTYAQAAVAGGTAAAVAAAAAFTLVSAEEPMPRPVAKPAASAGPPPVWPADKPRRVPPARPAAPSATRGHRARLHATIGVLGALVRDQPGIIGLRLRNSGNAPTAELTATVDLPAGVTLIPSGDYRHGAAAGVTLTRPRGSDHAAAPIQRGGYEHGAVTGGMSIHHSAVTDGMPSRPGGNGHGVAAGGTPIRPGVYGHGAEVVTPVGTVDGWTCRPAGKGAVCARGPLEARRRTAVFLRVQVAAQAPQGDGPAVRITSGSLRVGARSAAGVRREGMPARFATDGKVTVRAVGNSLLSCPLEDDGCAEARLREGDRRDDELWPMAVVDEDKALETYASSGATLRLPPGGRVVWAGLYWSASGENAGPIRLRPPGRRRYLFIKPEQVTVRELPSGPAYQAFADVTGLVGSVRQEGRWWAADPPMGEGVAQHAGWSLVVIATDPTEPYSHAVVLDTPTVVGGEAGQARIPLDGLVPAPAPDRGPRRPRASVAPAAERARGSRDGMAAPATVPTLTLRKGPAPAAERARIPGGGPASGGSPRRVPSGGLVPARIEMVAWGGDADLDGDRLSLGSGPLTPEGGDRDADNVFDGSSNGTKGMTFGVDVDTFGTELGHDPALAIDTRKDVVLFAIAAVSVRARS
ncbi:sigma-70 family RNA polymerase sigma factor [Nonomuraea sp. NPDC050680]|uniref:sigma-70 family RNA polymerase sigma factor n=1 Tax=Nonomuraea sp. NPDC050680 TaxID=3154630 RepID=UPI0033D63201